MNNYMKRLVSAKKKIKDDPSENQETKARNSPSEAAVPVGTTSPTSPTREAKITSINTTNDDKGAKMMTSNKPSPRRVRRYMRRSAGIKNDSESPSSEPQLTPENMNDDNSDAETPSRDSADDDYAGDELFEEIAVTMHPKSSEPPIQGLIPWDEGGKPNISMTSSPIRSMLLEKENVERELAEVQIDRDILRQQLLQARAELENARSSLRENVSDLEYQLRSLQQSERRQTELEENALLEEEIDELARLAREEEGEKASAELAASAAAAGQHRDTIVYHNGNKDTMDGDGITISTEGAVILPIDPAGPSSSEDKVEEHVSGLLSREEQSHKKRVAELEDALTERKLREHILDEEVRQLKEQAQVESQKFEEAQRQVRWFEQELKAMFPKEDETSSMSLSSSEEHTIGGNDRRKNDGDDNQNNAAYLETIMESNIDDKKGDEHICVESTTDACGSDSDSTKEKNGTGKWFDKSSDSNVDPSIHVICEDDNELSLSSPYLNFLPPDNLTQNSSKTEPPSPDDSIHVKLLHEQRLELEKRVQELLDEIGTLRQGQRTYQHEKQKSDIDLIQLQTDLQQQQEQHRLELVLVERQLAEWKDRSDSFQTNLTEGRNLAEHQNALNQLERRERHELTQRVEELELEKNELRDNLEKSRIGFEHEKGYLKRAMESLENKLQETCVDSCSETLNSNNGDTTPLHEDSSRLTQAVFSKQQISDHEFSRDEEAWKGLLHRIQDLEAEGKIRIESERALREQLKNSTEKEKVTKNQATAAEDRVRMLQKFLDASFSASPKRERQLELEQEYISVHSRNRDEDENNQEKILDVLSESTKKSVIAINSNSTKSMNSVEVKRESTKIEDDAQQSISELSTNPGQKSSPESPARTPKLRDVEEQSITSDALVHNLHLKLDKEMENLKKRKERRRARARSTSTNPPSGSLHKSKASDPNAEKAVAVRFTQQTEKVATRKELLSTDSQSLISNGQHCSNDRSEDEQQKPSKVEDEFRKKSEEENSRLKTSLETINYNKAQLEIQLDDAMQQIKVSVNQIDTLNAEIIECRCTLEQCEKGKSELVEQIDLIRNETAQLKNVISENKEEKMLFETTLSKLKEALNVKEKMIIEYDESHRMKLEEMKKALDGSSRVGEEEANNVNDTNASQINHLEAKILLIETESKVNFGVLSNELDRVLEERNALELKFRDSSKELDECKQKESSLREGVEENIKKLESAQDEIEELSKRKVHEISELGKIVFDKTQRIADLEKDVSGKQRRLEQASIQLSELENELFERDEEIEKLDAKRYQFQENASKQLVEIENCLERESEENDRLEEEKSKLQYLVQKYEDQIEKQVGRLVEASSQLSELESEIFAKDDEIDEMELRINAMQALEAQRVDILHDSEIEKKSLEEQLECSKQTIQSLYSQVRNRED